MMPKIDIAIAMDDDGVCTLVDEFTADNHGETPATLATAWHIENFDKTPLHHFIATVDLPSPGDIPDRRAQTTVVES